MVRKRPPAASATATIMPSARLSTSHGSPCRCSEPWRLFASTALSETPMARPRCALGALADKRLARPVRDRGASIAALIKALQLPCRKSSLTSARSLALTLVPKSCGSIPRLRTCSRIGLHRHRITLKHRPRPSPPIWPSRSRPRPAFVVDRADGSRAREGACRLNVNVLAFCQHPGSSCGTPLRH